VKSIILMSIAGLFISTSAFAAENNFSYEQFSECTAVTSWLMKGRQTAKIESKKRVQIPEGWKVVGTNVIDETPILFICR